MLAIGIEAYRLQGAKADVRQLTLEKTERARRDAMRDATNLRNRDRTNEEYAAARARAARVVVRNDWGIKYTPPPSPGGGDERTVCFDRDLLERELAAFAGRHAGRLEELARAGEGLAAAYRACRGYTLNLQ